MVFSFTEKLGDFYEMFFEDALTASIRNWKSL
ncbi:hypothetical protein [Kineothrix sp. MB12-C1]|nr:hypothetical protein [Kineothrix sp. MB12-C1]WMC94559.1 hypothetical protein RBB56_18160 [Kineothrix sp. MB12-C1]